MAWLIDTNILLRMAQPGHPMHRAATTAVKILLERGERLCIVPQNLTEFWSVATRGLGSLNGLGMDVDEARQEVLRLINLLQFMPEIPAIFPIWLRLVSDHRITGVHVYDARLVASMEAHSIDSILTFNLADFRRYSKLRIVSPEAVAVSP